MAITLGELVLSAGPRAEPYRTAAGSARRTVQTAQLIRADSRVYDRKNRIFEETLEVAYSYASAELAEQGWLDRRAAALAQPKAPYTREGATTGDALIESVTLVWRDGCGITLSYHIIGEFAANSF